MIISRATCKTIHFLVLQIALSHNSSAILNIIASINSSFLPVLLLLVIAPYCTTRFLFPHIKLVATIASTCMMIVILNTITPIVLHIFNIQINYLSLIIIHALLSVLSYISIRLKKISITTSWDNTDKQLLIIIGLFAIIIFPFTALAGIDTYKWLDLATSMKVEQSIPWLVHPLSLFGYTTGRSYPSAQPLILGTIMTISNLNIELSFYFMSLISGILGITSVFLLAQKIFSTQIYQEKPNAMSFGKTLATPSRPHTPTLPHYPLPLYAAFFYGFSPVFIRYNHWATGRGLFLAVFPLFLLTLLNLSIIEIKKLQTNRTLFIIENLTGLILLGVFLPLSHKAGLIALLLILVSLPSRLLLPHRNWRWLIPALTLIAIIPTIILSPNEGAPLPFGLILGFIYTSITRFGILLPLAAIGLLAANNWLTNPHLRRILPALLLLLPFSCSREMYGALIALIFITIAAANGFILITEKFQNQKIIIKRIITIFIIIGALAIIIHRSITATPRRIRTAALFLEQYDPTGPFMITSNNWRTKIQGYVSGCPRFKITKTDAIKIHIQRPPKLNQPPAKLLAAITSYSRHIITVSGLSLSYYGENPRHYIFHINNPSQTPTGTIRIYNKDGIEIFKPINQKIIKENT